MAKLVKICRNNYTVMNNAMWRDPKLGATERGVLGTMLTLPDTWDFSIKGLSTLFPDGERKIGTSLKKIEEAGYLKRVRIYTNGKIIDWEYQFSDEPIFFSENKEQSSNNCDVENNAASESDTTVEKYVENSVNVENNVESNVENPSDNLHCQNSNVGNNTPEESLDCRFEDVENLHLRKSNANKIYNNKINNNQFTLSKSNQSISNKGKKPNVENSNDVENSDDVIDEIDFKETLEEVSIQISADYLRSRSPEDYGLIDEITHIIANAYTTHCQYLRIGGDSIDINLVRQRFQLLDYSHIEYVEDCLKKTTTFIQNRKNYLLTCLYFAPITIDGYYLNLVNHNMRGAI